MYSGPVHYNGAKYAAKIICQYLGSNKQARCLDIAAGAGDVGQEVIHLNYNHTLGYACMYVCMYECMYICMCHTG